MSCTLELADTKDLDRAVELIEMGRALLKERGIPQWQHGYPNHETLFQDIAEKRLYLMYDDGRPVCVMVILLTGDSDYDQIDGAWLSESSSSAPTYAALHRVATDTTHLRKGYMQKAFRAAAAIAKSHGKLSIRVDTHERNHAMRQMLTKLGYTECGVVYITPSSPEDVPERIAFELVL